MTFRITVLCENSVGPLSGTLGEHGFAALVEWEGGSLLFDTGQGETLLPNAGRMHKDLHRVGAVALSHGHYDHTGGLWPLLRSCGPKEVHAHPAVFSQRYRVRPGEPAVAIGIPYSQEFLEGQGATFHLHREFREIGPGIFLTGEVPRNVPSETGDRGLCCDGAGAVADPLPDDQSLVLRTDRGLLLLLGCCHAGLINTVEHARKETGIDDVYGVIGGTHLGFCPEIQVEATVRRLRELRVAKICASHCTGISGMCRLAREFPGQFQPAQVGYTLEI